MMNNRNPGPKKEGKMRIRAFPVSLTSRYNRCTCDRSIPVINAFKYAS